MLSRTEVLFFNTRYSWFPWFLFEREAPLFVREHSSCKWLAP